MDLSDFALIDKALNAPNRAKFAALGGGYLGVCFPLESRPCPMQLAGLLDRPGPARIDLLFRESRLYREKWERQDYRDRTITKALADTTEIYSPGHDAGQTASGYGAATGGASPNPATEAAAWPVMASEALYGLAGEFVRLVGTRHRIGPSSFAAAISCRLRKPDRPRRIRKGRGGHPLL